MTPLTRERLEEIAGFDVDTAYREMMEVATTDLDIRFSARLRDVMALSRDLAAHALRLEQERDEARESMATNAGLWQSAIEDMKAMVAERDALRARCERLTEALREIDDVLAYHTSTMPVEAMKVSVRIARDTARAALADGEATK